MLAYYEKQVDERPWYGFWQYGDLMHSYPRRATCGITTGAARRGTTPSWATPLWLWYSFLRTGRADLYRLAEAHTRNTSETDVYHLGDMAGLGSRHNVIKWGDGAKEARISQAAHWRFYYYLTTDERTGDIMHEMAEPPTPRPRRTIRCAKRRRRCPASRWSPARIRIGPDWFAFAGNWMTEWERTGDTRWRDRILAGVDSMLAMPYWLQSGQMNAQSNGRSGGTQMVGYDIETGKLTAIRDPVTKVPMPAGYNLATIQGGGEVMFELVPLLGRKDFENAWPQYCRIGNAPAEVLTRDKTTGNEGADEASC